MLFLMSTVKFSALAKSAGLGQRNANGVSDYGESGGALGGQHQRLLASCFDLWDLTERTRYNNLIGEANSPSSF